MRSRASVPGRGAMRGGLRSLVLAAALAAGAAHAGEAAPPQPDPTATSAEQVKRVVAEMRTDPTLNGKHTEHELRWKNLDRAKPERSDTPHWLIRLARWLAEASRGIVWLLGAIAVAVVAVFAWRWASVRSEALRARAELAPSHVNELDIRPESLPADIGGTALALCRRGELRAALSLLYRGALSRLVHDRLVPIRAASTEGECVRLAEGVLPAAGSAYFGRLVGAWQTEVYAGRSADAAAVAALCEAFETHFAARSPAGTPATMATA